MDFVSVTSFDKNISHFNQQLAGLENTDMPELNIFDAAEYISGALKYVFF